MCFSGREMVNKTESLLPSKEVKAKLASSEVLVKPAPGAIKVRHSKRGGCKLGSKEIASVPPTRDSHPAKSCSHYRQTT